MEETKDKKSPIKTIIKWVLFILIALLIAFGLYISIIYLNYSRILNNQALEINYGSDINPSKSDDLSNGVTYSALSYNIGFGAYTPDFSYYMDGGSQSVAESKESVLLNTGKISDLLQESDADFISLQEVDSDSDRSYHVDQTNLIQDELSKYSNITACCFDGPYLLWPPFSPVGKSVSNIMTLSKFSPDKWGARISLPVDRGPAKLIDYDRCFSISRYATQNGKELVWYNTHLSDFTFDNTIYGDQLWALTNSMQKEYEKGNYVICAADFNRQIIPNMQNYFSKNEVANIENFPVANFQDGSDLKLIAPFDKGNPCATARDAKEAYGSSSKISSIDGFLVSSNISITESKVIDTNFQYSDHNPVYIKFKLL